MLTRITLFAMIFEDRYDKNLVCSMCLFYTGLLQDLKHSMITGIVVVIFFVSTSYLFPSVAKAQYVTSFSHGISLTTDDYGPAWQNRHRYRFGDSFGINTAIDATYLVNDESFLANISVGGFYMLDILQHVPEIWLDVGNQFSIDEKLEPFIRIGIGIDWLQNRSLSLGTQFSAKFHENTPPFYYVGIRLTTWFMRF